MLSEEVELFAATAVDVGVALLEAYDGLARLEPVQAHGQELFLCLFSIAGEFAGDVDFGAAGDEIEDGCGDEFVGEDEVGGLNGTVGCEGEEVGIARAGAGEDDPSSTSSFVEGGGV